MSAAALASPARRAMAGILTASFRAAGASQRAAVLTSDTRWLSTKPETSTPEPPSSTSAEGDPSAEGEAGSSLPPTVETLQQSLADAQAALAEEQKRSAEHKDRMLRTLADMENLRDRMSRQMAQQKLHATEGLLKSLVDVADDLERATQSVPEAVLSGEQTVDAEAAVRMLRSLRDGVRMTDGILMNVFKKQGVERFDPTGQPFDPDYHAALMEVNDPSKDPKTIAIVIKKGYKYEDRALRAADVGVVAARPDASS